LAAPATTTFAHLVVADFDGDAHDDDFGGVRALRRRQPGSSPSISTPERRVHFASRFAAAATRTSATYASMTDLAVADLQADGVVDAGTGHGLRIGLDLLAANNGPGSVNDAVAISRFDGTSPEAFAACTSTGGPVAVATGDLDGNGLVDMITANAGARCAFCLRRRARSGHRSARLTLRRPTPTSRTSRRMRWRSWERPRR
jgi:hypothetical protein